MGSLHTIRPLKCTDNSGFVIAGNQLLTTSGAIDATDGAAKGAGWSMTKTGTGTYQITLARPLNDIFSVQVQLLQAALTDLVAVVEAYDVAAKTVDLRIVGMDGTPAETDPASGDEIMFSVHCVANSSK